MDSMTSRRYTVLLDSVYAILDKVLAVYHPMYDAEKALFSEDQKRIISENLNTVKKEALAMEPDQQRQELLAYYIHNLLYYLNYSKIEREKLMADNITWLIGRHPEAKIVYLAHNQHVGNRNNGETKSTGGWLKKRYGDRYDIIATCYYTGTDLFKQHALGSQQAINVSLKGSYERLFNQQEENCFYLDLKQVRNRKQTANEWLTKSMLMRNYGVEPFNYYYEFTITDLTREYDGVLFIKESVPL